LLAVTVVGLFSLEIVRQYSRQQETAALRDNADAIAEQAFPLLLTGAPVFEFQQLAQAASFLGDNRVRILSDQGGVIADSGAPSAAEELILILPDKRVSSKADAWLSLQLWTRGESFLLTPEGLQLIAELPPDSILQLMRRYSDPWGERLDFSGTYRKGEDIQTNAVPEPTPQTRSTSMVRQPIGGSDNPLGYVELSAGPAFGTAALTATRRAFFFGGAGATLLAALVGLVMSHRLTSPLRQLGKAAGRMGEGDMSARAGIASQDEIGALATQFDQMADQLQVSFSTLQAERDALRRFVADASHELRTPITALKNFLTLLQDPATKDQKAKAEFLTESQEQVERLEWITRHLLDLTRLDAGLIDLDTGDHDIGEVLVAAASPFNPIAEEKGILLKVQEPVEQVTLHCDLPRLEMALGNLLDNAVKFTPTGGTVSISGGRTGDITRIWVEDNGPGINEEDLPHIFERFYRGRSQTGSGSGLGLAIAKSLVEIQGGQVRVESDLGKGTKITLEWGSSSGTEDPDL
jgi:signal transduction histidine kinase